VEHGRPSNLVNRVDCTVQVIYIHSPPTPTPLLCPLVSTPLSLSGKKKVNFELHQLAWKSRAKILIFWTFFPVGEILLLSPPPLSYFMGWKKKKKKTVCVCKIHIFLRLKNLFKKSLTHTHNTHRHCILYY
jgi:hypothetical protein